MRHLILSASLLVVASLLQAAEPAQPQKTVEITVGGSVAYGPVEGFMQTPLGGDPGTTSLGRPTLHELNINDAVTYDAHLNARWRHFGFFGEYHFIRFDESATLTQPLISHDVPFPAGDAVHTKDQFDWYGAGAGWGFDFLNGRLNFFPKAEAAILDFGYKLSDATGSANRAYTIGCVRLGLESTYHITDRLALRLNGDTSLPISNMPQIATVFGTVDFKLLSARHAVNPSVFIGGGAEWIDYRDSQPVPNHVRADLGPLVTAGVRLSF